MSMSKIVMTLCCGLYTLGSPSMADMRPHLANAPLVGFHRFVNDTATWGEESLRAGKRMFDRLRTASR